ncbi:MAG: DNA adenine methylase [Methylophilaceae bacterium]
MKQLKTPLRYPGGKSRATKFLFSKLPEKIRAYREPFLGGGSVAIEFTKRFPECPVWVNDKYANLYHFWSQLQKNGEALYSAILNYKLKAESYEDVDAAHRELFLKSREEISGPLDPFGIAVRFFIINKCSFSGLGESSGFSAAASKQNFSKNNISRLPKYSELIQNWLITNDDYTKVLEGCEQDEFVFCDPPYDIKSALYGKNGKYHLFFDHYEFSVDATKCAGNVMITYNSNEVLREIYEDWNQIEWDLTYTMHSGKMYREDESNRKELLITNYETK